MFSCMIFHTFTKNLQDIKPPRLFTVSTNLFTLSTVNTDVDNVSETDLVEALIPAVPQGADPSCSLEPKSYELKTTTLRNDIMRSLIARSHGIVV